MINIYIIYIYINKKYKYKYKYKYTYTYTYGIQFCSIPLYTYFYCNVTFSVNVIPPVFRRRNMRPSCGTS